jgi:hypothetical protein
MHGTTELGCCSLSVQMLKVENILSRKLLSASDTKQIDSKKYYILALKITLICTGNNTNLHSKQIWLRWTYSKTHKNTFISQSRILYPTISINIFDIM